MSELNFPIVWGLGIMVTTTVLALIYSLSGRLTESADRAALFCWRIGLFIFVLGVVFKVAGVGKWS